MTNQAKLEAALYAANETIRLKDARIRGLEAENERLKAKNEWLKAQMGLWVLRYGDRPKKASETDDATETLLRRVMFGDPAKDAETCVSDAPSEHPEGDHAV